MEDVKWCRDGDLNPDEVAPASPSSWCVCQFRHPGTIRDSENLYSIALQIFSLWIFHVYRACFEPGYGVGSMRGWRPAGNIPCSGWGLTVSKAVPAFGGISTPTHSWLTG